MNTEEQIERMREWFFNHFEDPAESLPYISAEGGYIPIYGPLQYTDEILFNEFSGEYDEEVIEELVEDLGDYNFWSPLPDESWYEPYEEYSTEESLTAVEMIVTVALNDLEKTSNQINAAKTLVEHSDDFYQMIFARIYAIIESFLSNFIVKYIDENFEELIMLKGEHSELRKIQIPLTAIHKAFAESDPKINIDKVSIAAFNKYYEEMLWQKNRFEDARKIYAEFGFNLSIKGTTISEHIYIRHDIVHRDGRKKGKTGDKHVISEDILLTLLKDAVEVVNTLGEQYTRKIQPKNLDLKL